MRILTLFLVVLFLIGCTNQTQKENNIPPNISNSISTPITENKTSEDIIINATDNGIAASTNDTTSITAPDNANIVSTSKNYSLTVYYFFSQYCVASIAIQPEIDKLEKKYNGSVLFVRYNITESAAFAEYNRFAIVYNLSNKSRLSPLAYIKDKVLIGRFEINDSLEKTIKEELGAD